MDNEATMSRRVIDVKVGYKASRWLRERRVIAYYEEDTKELIVYKIKREGDGGYDLEYTLGWVNRAVVENQ